MDKPLTREELYELVWSEPISRLAPKFGISDVGLAKLCRRVDVPIPGRGYWAKLQSGKKGRRTPLPRSKSDSPVVISIKPTPPKKVVSPLELPPAVKHSVEKVTQGPEIVVPEKIRRPHPIIAKWIEEEREFKRRHGGRWEALRTQSYSPGVEKRRLRLLDALLKALEKRGFKVKLEAPNKEVVEVMVGQEPISFIVSEGERYARKELTAEEKKSTLYSGRPWRRERELTGELVFRIRTWSEGHKSEWRDKRNLPLERQLGEVIGSLIIVGELHRRRRIEREEDHRRRMLDMQARWRQEEARKAEAARFQGLIKRAAQWRQAAEIRAYVEAVAKAADARGDIDQQKLREWSEWALAHADGLDPLVSGDPLSTDLDDSDN